MNHSRLRCVSHSFLLFALMSFTPAAAQTPGSISVSVDGKAAITLTIDDLKKLPLHAVDAIDVREAIKYEGASVADVLTHAGLLFGQNMRGDRLKDYLVVETADKYRVVFALPEIDRQFTDATTIIAYQRNGKPLSDLDGAFRVVHSTDKRHARWARKVVALKVQSAQ
jgi:DMSO/TMAO reductase YedYZ molybdopterin-dependent catalytic subunit